MSALYTYINNSINNSRRHFLHQISDQGYFDSYESSIDCYKQKV